MKTLYTMLIALVLLVTIGLRTPDTDFALNEVNDAHSMAQTLASADGGSVDEPGTDGTLADI